MQNKSVNTYLERKEPERRVPGRFPINRIRAVDWFKNWRKDAKANDENIKNAKK